MIAAMFAAAMVLLAQGAPASAPDTAPSPAPPGSKSPNKVSGVTVQGEKPKKNAPDPTEVVCHKEAVLGSLFPKQVCAQRQEIAERTREDQKQLRDSTLLNPLKGN